MKRTRSFHSEIFSYYIYNGLGLMVNPSLLRKKIVHCTLIGEAERGQAVLTANILTVVNGPV